MHIRDQLYGAMTFSTFLVAVIDTPEFQRLHRIQQLGLTSLVYPGATHTRKAHSLGTCHLAGVWMRHLQQKQPELHITSRLIDLIRLAALLHDVGHMPYSHTFDDVLVPILNPSKHKSHEERSVIILKALRARGVVYLTDEEETLVAHVMTGEVPPETRFEPYLYTVVASDLDVDRLDYLKRDSAYTGVPAAFQVDRIIGNSRVIHGRMAFHDKVAPNILQVFTTRFYFHSEIYQHKTCKVLEAMLAEAFRRLPDHIQQDMRDALDDPAQWNWFNDVALWQLMKTHPGSEEILEDIDCRRLWHASLTRPGSASPKGSVSSTVHFGRGQQNPMHNLWFFDPEAPNELHRWNPQPGAAGIPEFFQEKRQYDLSENQGSRKRPKTNGVPVSSGCPVE